MDLEEEVRQRFAREVTAACGVSDPRIVAAFARVPREAFLGPGPWLVLPDDEGYRSTPSADPAHIYVDQAVAIDAVRMLNNGAPSLLAGWIDSLELREGESVAHLGCATGYYSAILAEVVGPGGRVIAVELDPELHQAARKTLRPWKQIEVRHADALDEPRESVDAVLVHAGVTHAQPRWLEALGVGGRLAMPVTAIRPAGRIRRIVRDHGGRVLVLRREALGWNARFEERVGIQALLGGRNPEIQETLRASMTAEGGSGREVRSLRLDPHEEGADCWAHAPGHCLSRRAVGESK